MKALLNELKYRATNKIKFLAGYWKSKLGGFLMRKKFEQIDFFCLFVGYGRSGHTLIASLLNAHPDIVIGIEWGVFIYQKLGYRKNQIYYSLIENSRKYSQQRKNVWTGYSYLVPGSWQGKYRNLRVIGDKHAGTNATKLINDKGLITITERLTGIKPKLIHTIRNPFDNITTITIRRNEDLDPFYEPVSFDLLPYIDKYFKNARLIMDLKEKGEYEIIDIFHEDLIERPKETLAKLIMFFGQGADDDYLENCSRIIYKEPNRSRYNIQWPPELIELIENEMKKYPFFERYSYNN